MFQVGQKVVCVEGPRNDLPDFYSAIPVEGGIYTVSGFHPNGPHSIYLAEINSLGGFYARRFRPVVERKTDISIFTAMLNPQNQRVDA